MAKHLILYLIIYTCFSSESFCQNLNLKIIGADSLETVKIDSIGYQKKHINYASLEKEIDTFYQIINKYGYKLKGVREPTYHIGGGFLGIMMGT